MTTWNTNTVMNAAAASLAVSAICGAATPPATPIADLVIYAVDADTSWLLRYTFANDGAPDDFKPIGEIRDQNGMVLDHPQAFTYVPTGPYKGFYAVPSGKDSTGGPKHVLASIDGFDGKAFCYPAPFTYQGIRGMTAIPGVAPGSWRMLALAHNNWNAKLVEINPADGLQTVVLDLPRTLLTQSDGVTPCTTSSTQGCEWEGLSRHKDADKLYGVTGWALYEIDLIAGTVTRLFNHVGYHRTESLEIAFGDGTQKIDIPGVPASWTKNGALFAFSDNLNKLLVYDIGSGNPISAAEYNCSFVTVDCEGLVFVTKQQDPYGNIVVEPRD